MAGVRIYCRGKIAAQTAVFGRTAGFTGEHSVRSYLVGELHANWLDEEDDLIQTDRRDILWSDEVAAAFQAWGQHVVTRIGTLSRDPLRVTVHERFMEVGKVVDRIEKAFPGTEQKQIRDQAFEVAKTLGRSLSSGEVEDTAVVDDFVELTIMLAPHITLDEMLRAAANNATTPFSAVSGILRTARLAELASFGRIADDRLKVIERLKMLKDTDTDEAELQKLIEQAPWLINPQWAPITANESFTSLRKEFQRYYKKTTGVDINIGNFSDSTKRPDFVLSNQDGALQIIEIKKPNHKITNSEMDRIVKYHDVLVAFLSDPANVEFKQMYTGFRITLVSDGFALTGAQKISFDALKNDGLLEHIGWSTFLLRTSKMHQAFLKEAEKQRKYVTSGG